MMDMNKDKITIDGITYLKEAPPGKRAVIVIDRGWIYAGDVAERDGRIHLNRAVWVLRWESVGFDGMIAHPEGDGVHLRKMNQIIDIPKGSELYRVHVSDDWGLGIGDDN